MIVSIQGIEFLGSGSVRVEVFGDSEGRVQSTTVTLEQLLNFMSFLDALWDAGMGADQIGGIDVVSLRQSWQLWKPQIHKLAAAAEDVGPHVR